MKIIPIMIFSLIVVFSIIPSVLASNHYTFEHAEEMRVSGRIEWRDYGPEALNEAIEDKILGIVR